MIAPIRLWTWLLLLLLLSDTSLGLASTIKLAWDVPTLNADGTPLVDLAGYRLTFCVGGTCNPTVGGTDISPDLGLVTTYLHTGRTPGTDYRYAIRAKNSTGQLSSFSTMGEGRAPAGDLLALWLHDDTGASTTATDDGWFGVHGTLCEGATCPQQGPTWVTGQILTAASFDGTTDRVQIPAAAALNNLAIKTVAGWVKIPSYSGSGGLFVAAKESCGGGWYVFINATTRTLTYDHCYNTVFPSWKAPNNAIPENTWVHVAVVFDRTNVTNDPLLYINSVSQPVTETAASGGTVTDDSDGILGLGLCVGCAGLAGQLDEVRLYNYALTATEIRAIAIAPAAPTGIQLR